MAITFDLNTKKNFCRRCDLDYNYLDAKLNKWKCKNCKHHLAIKFEVDKRYLEIQILHPNEIKVGMHLIFGNSIHSVLSVLDSGANKYMVALKDYGVVDFYINDEMGVLNGTWSL